MDCILGRCRRVDGHWALVAYVADVRPGLRAHARAASKVSHHGRRARAARVDGRRGFCLHRSHDMGQRYLSAQSESRRRGLAAGYVVLVLLSLLLLSAVAPMSMAEERQRGSADVPVPTPSSALAILVSNWCRLFRLVPLLALGPGLIALALATAPRAEPAASFMQAILPSGAGAVRFATTNDAVSRNAPARWELSLGNRLSSAALLVMTILAHGAATTSIGLVLAIWIKRSSWAIAISVCMFVLVAVVWPFVVFGLLSPEPSNGVGMSALSPIAVAGFFVVNLMTREPQYSGIVWWATLWIVLVSLFAIALLWISSRSFIGRFEEMDKTTPNPSPGSIISKPDLDAVFVARLNFAKHPFPARSRMRPPLVQEVP